MGKIEYEPHEHGGMIETEESYAARMDEKYAPTPGKPWRVAWGFGCFSDHATEEEARREYDGIEKRLMPQEPFRNDEREE